MSRTLRGVLSIRNLEDGLHSNLPCSIVSTGFSTYYAISQFHMRLPPPQNEFHCHRHAPSVGTRRGIAFPRVFLQGGDGTYPGAPFHSLLESGRHFCYRIPFPRDISCQQQFSNYILVLFSFKYYYNEVASTLIQSRISLFEAAHL